MFALSRRLSLRHLRAAPLRSALVVLGIALGVAVVVAARVTSASMLSSFDDLVERVAGRADLIVAGGEAGVAGERVAEIAEIEGVAHAAAALEITTRFADDGAPLLVLGVDFLGDTHFLPFEPAPGQQAVVNDPLAFVNDPQALLISRRLARERGLSVGSEVTLLAAEGPETLRVWGILEDGGPAASFGGQVAVMALDAAQISFARGTLVDRIDIALAPDADAATVSHRVEAKLAGSGHVERPQEAGERLRALSAPLSQGLQMSSVIALIVGAFLIYNAIGVAVTQRRREIGVLRTLGLTRRGVVAYFCLEAAVLAVFGIAAGFALAFELVDLTHGQASEAIRRLFVASPEAPHISPYHFAEGALAGLSMAVAAAWLPARGGARLQPVAALRRSASLTPASAVPVGRLTLVGAVSVALAWVIGGRATLTAGYIATVMNLGGMALMAPLVVVTLRRVLREPARRLFGVPGLLGLDNVERNLGRSTINVLALMVAVAMSVAVSGWLRSFEQSIRDWFEQVAAADLAITAGSPVVDRQHVPLAPTVLDHLAGLPGIERVQPMRMVEEHYGDRTFQLVASNTQAFLAEARQRGRGWRVLDGQTPIADDALAAAPRIVLGDNAAQRLGLAAGDTMRLSTPTGPVDFEVRAVVVDYSSELGAGFIDRELYVQKWGDEAIDVVNLYLAPDADRAAIAREVRRRLGGGDALFVSETTELREHYLSLVHKSFAYTRSIELIVLVIALMGVVGTLIAAVLDRVRELGILRAVGARRGQVVRALVTEAAFLGFCAALGGVGAGAAHCALFLRTLVAGLSGWHLPFVFPTEGALRIAVFVVATAAVAGLVPGLRAARLDIKDALAHE